MSDKDNVTQIFNNVNEEVDKEIKIEQLQDEMVKKVREEVVKKFYQYRTTLNFMAADAPIAVLGLPMATEVILRNQGLLRVYDLFDLDLTKIEGLSDTRLRDLTTSINQFFSML